MRSIRSARLWQQVAPLNQTGERAGAQQVALNVA